MPKQTAEIIPVVKFPSSSDLLFIPLSSVNDSSYFRNTSCKVGVQPGWDGSLAQDIMHTHTHTLIHTRRQIKATSHHAGLFLGRVRKTDQTLNRQQPELRINTVLDKYS